MVLKLSMQITCLLGHEQSARCGGDQSYFRTRSRENTCSCIFFKRGNYGRETTRFTEVEVNERPGSRTLRESQE